MSHPIVHYPIVTGVGVLLRVQRRSGVMVTCPSGVERCTNAGKMGGDHVCHSDARHASWNMPSPKLVTRICPVIGIMSSRLQSNTTLSVIGSPRPCIPSHQQQPSGRRCNPRGSSVLSLIRTPTRQSVSIRSRTYTRDTFHRPSGFLSFVWYQYLITPLRLQGLGSLRCAP